MTRLGRAGYSVLEVLIGAAILAVLFGAAIFVWTQSGRMSTRENASVHAMRDLNLVFVRMRDDLGAMVLDREVAAGAGAPIEISLFRTTVASLTTEVRFFKIHDSIPETNQPVAGQLVYRLEGPAGEQTLVRTIHDVTAGGISQAALERREYCRGGLRGFRLACYSRDKSTGTLEELTDSVLRYDAARLPDCLYLELAHKDASRITGYVTVASRHVQTRAERARLYWLDNWMVPADSGTAGAPVGQVTYHPANSLNIGGTGVVLSAATLR
ncbi:MAG: hypothetical protein HYY25_01335 [Candidatus Wallbacteria bacterium]|nr:hypothetical protein [Candidatus Wallbacteria bacterium]